MIPVAEVHTAEVHGDFELAFACAHCGHAARAHVRATGRGESTGLPVASRPAELAARRAAADLPSDARELVALARCPKCRRRGTRAVRSWWLVHGIQVAFVLAVFVGLPALAFRFLLSASITTSELAWGVLVVPYLGARYLLRLRHVDRSVTVAP